MYFDTWMLYSFIKTIHLALRKNNKQIVHDIWKFIRNLKANKSPDNCQSQGYLIDTWRVGNQLYVRRQNSKRRSFKFVQIDTRLITRVEFYQIPYTIP